ncbi:hypothetical protein [Candidatus Coxiella mudrowiae]|uniref:Uncharacterized protein n=1 Tax=Candidatus Coxiella mudrowiae TaxID=2054173 RepID=A0ABN4HSE0_9COXI|nr:hypothetical protein [Candidatus Coxiella mudrowiae]AKQ33625.1 hypothetical protein CleRT_08410 [Candidatus Coxiella mudrowiae]
MISNLKYTSSYDIGKYANRAHSWWKETYFAAQNLEDRIRSKNNAFVGYSRSSKAKALFNQHWRTKEHRLMLFKLVSEQEALKLRYGENANTFNTSVKPGEVVFFVKKSLR